MFTNCHENRSWKTKSAGLVKSDRGFNEYSRSMDAKSARKAALSDEVSHTNELLFKGVRRLYRLTKRMLLGNP